MTAPLAFDVRRFGSVDSTNTRCRELAEQGAGEGTLVVAAEQTGGRGRHGRQWHSPPGNFYGSLLLRPALALADAASLSLVIGLAALDAVEALAGRRLPVVVKWPNDLLLGRRKLAGILLEGVAEADGRCAWLVAGLGVNLASHPDLPGHPSTALAEEGIEGATVEAFLPAYLNALSRHLPVWQAKGFAPFRDAWLGRAAGLGQPVSLRIGDVAHGGILADLSPDGSILIESPLGCLQQFTAGELFFADAADGTSGPA
ncbi:MAG TPA: biotin--[acetyl-CoA-carboxylase] ligase [Geminicoccaceae bacterium]|nr:biotin--[acetyl-CoA-carboxylase] ligase [Geminicoccus sp.]HMU50261.1 biotin--[acetyl-CoA-carboxylase] ligase [Geminicoccaceae bacterium]